MSGLPIRSVTGNPILNNYVNGFTQDQGFIAAKIATPMPVDSVDSSFYTMPFSWGKHNESTHAGEDAPAPSSSPPLDQGTFTTRSFRHKVFLLAEKEDLAMRSPEGFKQITKHHSELAGQVVLLDYEVEAAAVVLNTANYYSAAHFTSLALADQWDNFAAATSQPDQDVINFARVIHMHSGVTRDKLTVALGPQVYDALVQHPRVRENVKYVQKANVSDFGLPELSKFFGVQEVIIGSAQQITSAIGISPEVSSYIWGKNVWIGYVDPAPNKNVPTAAAFVTPSTMGTQIPAMRTVTNDDPLGKWFIAEARLGIGKGAPTGEGVRSGALIQTAIA